MRMLFHSLCLISGMTFATAVSAKLPEVPDSEVAHCQPLGDVSASSGYGKNPNWQPIARTYAEKKAESLGATHVGSIQFIAEGTFNGEARLKAYSCP